MTIFDLTNIIKFNFDFADSKIDSSFYIEIEKINPKYAKQIEVKQINQDFIVCDFTTFILTHKTAIKNYIYKNYYVPFASKLYTGIYENDNKHDQADYLYKLIKDDIANILQK